MNAKLEKKVPFALALASWKQACWWPIFGAFVFFLLLWRLGYPAPWYDDLFYNGAALNMAQGGDFSNPLLDRQGFPGHYFFVYPPLHSYAVYVWLSVFGVSAASMLAFQNLMYFITAAVLIFLVCRHGSPKILPWIVPWAVIAVFLKLGLRPEAFAVAITMLGYLLFVLGNQTVLCTWLSYLLIALGGMAAPRTFFFGAALALVMAWQYVEPGQAGWLKRIRARWIVPGSALAFAALVFLVLIKFQLAGFYQAFHMHSARVKLGGVLGSIVTFGKMRWLTIFLLGTVILYLAARRVRGEAARICYFVAATFLFSIVARAFGPITIWHWVFIIFLLVSALSNHFSPAQTRVVEVIVATAFLLTNADTLIDQYGVMTGKINCRPPNNITAILALHPTQDSQVLIDVSVARYVFDYRIPPECIDFEFSAPFPGFNAADAKFRPQDIFVLGPFETSKLYARLHSHFVVERWQLGMFQAYPQLKYPRQAFIIPAKDCIAIQRKQNLAAKDN